MRRIKNKVMLVLAVFPLLIYALSVFRTGEMPSFVSSVETVFGSYGSFFTSIITPLFTSVGVDLCDSSALSFMSWLIGYYVCLILLYLVFSLFTFLITMFMDKIDSIKGDR